MYSKAYFPSGYFPGGFFPPFAAQPVGAPPDYDVLLHVGTAYIAWLLMEPITRNVRAHVGNAQTVTLRD
jgi:hypothetical protein